MDGMGIVKGMGVTLRRFLDTFVDDIKWLGKRYYTKEGVARRSEHGDARHLYRPVSRGKTPCSGGISLRPFLVYEEGPNGEKRPRCTSCGICAKVCPPQCIWIERTVNPNTGRPVPEPKAFYIDVDICMNCGFCAEYCPFDAIKMDHDYELSVYDRHEKNIYDLVHLLKPVSYYASIRPKNYAREEAAWAKAAHKANRLSV